MVETIVSIVFWLFIGTMLVGISFGIQDETTWGDTLPGIRSKIAHWSIAIGAIILLIMGVSAS